MREEEKQKKVEIMGRIKLAMEMLNVTGREKKKNIFK